MDTTPLSTVLSEITPLPWREERRHPDPWTAKGYAEIFGPNGEGVYGDWSSLPIACSFNAGNPRGQAHIAYILHATAMLPQLVAALEETVEHYCSLINSGDAGNWNPEEEAKIIAARAVLAKSKQVPSTTVPCPTTP